jgi:hypothetical protein
MSVSVFPSTATRFFGEPMVAERVINFSVPATFTIVGYAYTDRQIKILFNFSEGAQSFSVERDGSTIVTGITDTFYIDTVPTDAAYTYRVIAVNSLGNTYSSNTLILNSFLTAQELSIWDATKTILQEYLDITDFSTVAYNNFVTLPYDSGTGYPALLVYPVLVSNGATIEFRVAIHMKAYESSTTQTEVLVEQLEKISASLNDIAINEPTISMIRFANPKMQSFQNNIIEAYQELTVRIV